MAYCAADERSHQASDYLSQGEHRLLKDDLKGLELFEKALELDPSNPELFYRQGLALFEYGCGKGKDRALLWASKRFKMATHLAPSYFDAWHAWGNTLMHLGTVTGEHHYFVEAEEKLENALSLSDSLQSEKTSDFLFDLHWDFGKAWVEIAKHSDEAVDWNTALTAFEKAFQKSTSTQQEIPSEFWYDYGSASLAMESRINDPRFIIKAINCFKHSVSINVSYFEGWFLLARSMDKLYNYTHDEDHFTGAHECFSAAAHLRPYSLELWHEWALFLLEAGRKSRDQKRLRACIEKCQRGYVFDPKHAHLLATWADALALLGETTDKIEYLYEAQNKITEALDLSEDENPEIWHSHGKLLYSWGEYFEDLDYYYQAIEQFQEGISVDRTRHQDWYSIAKTYARVGTIQNDIDAFEKATRFYAKAIDLRPLSPYYFEYAYALSHLGEMKRDKELLKQSITYFEYIIQTQKNALYQHPEWLYQYAITLDILGDFDDDETSYQKAIEIFSQVIVLDPDFPRIHYRIGVAYSHLGEALGEPEFFQLALHHYRLALKQEEENDFVILDWGTTLINIAEHSLDKDIADQCFREAELKLTASSRLGNEQAFYQLACLYSLQREFDKSLFFLEKSHEAKSLPALEEILSDDWLEGLRLTAPFQEFIAHLQHG